MKALTLEQLEAVNGGSILANYKSDWDVEYLVVDYDGNIVASFEDWKSAFNYCFDHSIDAMNITWEEVERRRKQAQNGGSWWD